MFGYVFWSVLRQHKQRAFKQFTLNFNEAMDSSTVSYDDVKNVNSDGTLIDVREPKELEETGSIPNSINIPLGTLQTTFQELSDKEFKEKFGWEKPNKNALIIVSCKMGGRSSKAQVLLRGLGYTKRMDGLGKTFVTYLSGETSYVSLIKSTNFWVGMVNYNGH